MIRVALRPQWIAFLLLVMVVASVFAWLGQWQVSRAIEDAKPVDAETETVIPLTQLTEAATATPEKAGGHMTEVEGHFVPDGYTLLTGRLNQGTAGYWVVGRFVLTENTNSVPIAVGWAEKESDALAVARELSQQEVEPVTVIGRFMPTEGPELPDTNGDPFSEKTLSVASLVNLWPEFSGKVYAGYIVADNAPAGLEKIDSIPPMNQGEINWLNIFYAIEWVVFAGFAFYIWWRMVRDVYERERDEKSDAAAQLN